MSDTILLKDGSETQDPRLDRLIQFDERSREFPIMAAVPTGARPRSYTWRIDRDYLIDQGREGACVGFSLINELQARPSEVDFDSLPRANAFARDEIYHEAQRIDPWPGGAYPGASPYYEGTSVLAGVKVGQRLGFYREYRWAFGISDLVYGLGHNGPAILGLAWYDSNYRPDDLGFIRPRGTKVGGHAVLARAVRIVRFDENEPFTWDNVDHQRSFITIRNSWGQWGIDGDCYVTLADMAAWLSDRGEAVFVLKRRTEPRP